MRLVSRTDAISAARTEASRIATLAWSWCGSVAVKLSSVTSSDTVNPTPANIATPAMSVQVRESSRVALVAFVISQVVPSTPIVLPANSPKTMPSVIEAPSASTKPEAPPTATPAAKKANTGTAKPAESGCSRCSQCAPKLSRVSRSRKTGIANPSITPAIVACTPEACTSPQVTAARGSSSDHDRTFRRASRAKSPSGTSAAASRTGSRPVVKNNAMITIAIRSSTTASVSRNVRSAVGKWLPITASTARAKAMSVATGIAHPSTAPGVPRVTNR